MDVSGSIKARGRFQRRRETGSLAALWNSYCRVHLGMKRAGAVVTRERLALAPALSLALSLSRALFVAAALLAVVFAGEARAEKRIALVVGNSAYQNITRLDNPRNDAALMAE